MNINFCMPTRVIMSEECIMKNATLLKKLGHRALIVTGVKSSKENGALQDITEALSSQDIIYDLYDRVMANPTIACVYEGAAVAREFKADFIIGIGGGSPMDAAKAIALLAVNNIVEDELFTGKYKDHALPTVMVPTTAGTGAEVTANAVLTSDTLQTKKSVFSPTLYPKYALLDAKYTKNLPMHITVNTALDALSHAVEGMLSVRASEISNYIATDSINKISQCLRFLTPEQEQGCANLSIDIREKLLYGSMLAGIVISHTGTTAVHSMGYSLTYFKNIDHGRANALLLPSFLRLMAKNDPIIVNRILNPMSMNSVDEFETEFFRLLGDRESVTLSEVEKFTAISAKAKNVTNSRVVPSNEDIYNIFTRSLQITEIL